MEPEETRELLGSLEPASETDPQERVDALREEWEESE